MIIVAAQIEGIASRKDKTIRLTLGTQEVTPNDAATLFQLNQQLCYVAIKKEDFQVEELDIIENLKTEFENKTPSQRLRGILYRVYESNNEGYKDFSTYYLSKMEKICEHYKSKIDECR
jgi:hypothetical protein